MLLVRFNDLKATESQLEDAQDLFALSPAQTRLAALVLEGLDMPASAKQLGISLNTAKTHLQRLFSQYHQVYHAKDVLHALAQTAHLLLQLLEY